MSTIGANVQWSPCAVASTAAMRAERAAAAVSQLAASASGTGKIVRKPWITSCPKTSGILRGDCSTATRCIAHVYAAPNTLR
jgi:hypothetical protein